MLKDAKFTGPRKTSGFEGFPVYEGPVLRGFTVFHLTAM